jgi:alpha-ribazole phosphatase/probable phosphoglycerate mutase
MYCGELDGLLASEAQQRYPAIWEANRRQDDENLRWPGGESYREFRQRCLTGLRRIVQTHPGERIVAVTHAGVISQILGAIHGFHSAQWEPFRPGNASLTEIEWGIDGGTLLRFDDRTHLAGLEDDEPGAVEGRRSVVPAGNF